MDNFLEKVITSEEITTFIEGHDPQKRIVNMLYNYQDNFVSVVYRNEKDQKCINQEPFYPFVWATKSACFRLCGGNREELRTLMRKYNISVKKLSNINTKGEAVKEFDNGYMFQFFAKSPMSYTRFLAFFKEAKNPIYSKKKDDAESLPESLETSRQYLAVTPQEQFMIRTGKRFFKGYDDYDQVLKMSFDFETTGLNLKKDRIIQIGVRMNRPFNNRPDGFEKILTVTGETEEEKNKSELWCIDQMMRMIYTFKPDIITGYNTENFDWNILIEACTRLGTSIAEISSKYFNGESIRKEDRETSLKLGGEVETFKRTIVPGIIVTDGLHAVRRAQATDSNFRDGTLKGATKYLGLKKNNRVYTPGSEISSIWSDEVEHYAFNDNDGDWYLYDPTAPDAVVYTPEFDLAYFEDMERKEREALYTLDKNNPEDYAEYIDFLKEKAFEWHIENDFSDVHIKEVNHTYTEEESKRLEEFENFIEEGSDAIPTKEAEKWSKDFPFEEWALEHEEYVEPASSRYEKYINEINEKNAFKKGKNGDKPFVMYTRNYIADGYELKSGRYIIERYLYDDLEECDRVEYKLNTTNFLICKLLPVTYSKATTMGTAGQWKALMMAWSYENDLAIPLAENTGSFTGGLSRLLKTGYVDNVVKLDYNSLYPSIILTWGISDETDLMGTMLKFLEYVLTEREKYKGLKKAAGKIVDKYEDMMANGEKLSEEQFAEYHKAQADYAFNDKKQSQMKVFANSFFGFFGANNGSVAPWKSPKCAEQTTCTGRMALRLMIYHFHNLGYEPIVGDTDGFNFKLPDSKHFRYTEEHPYISTGMSRETKKDVKYTGFKADVAEFNDMFMCDMHYSDNAVNKMGLGIDEIVDATINFSRKNYADWFPLKPYPDDVKMVGNTIKSKKMPEYIAKFLGKGIRLLLSGKGSEFLDEYYSYIAKIYNLQIPLKDIASKGKVKKSLTEYIKDCKTTTKTGASKSRQAWMELAIQDNLHVDIGDTLYYVNTAKKKSTGDVVKETRYFFEGEDITKRIDKEYKAYKKPFENDEMAKQYKMLSKKKWVEQAFPNYTKTESVTLNCQIVPQSVINAESDVLCDDVIEYNVEKYIDMFNKRITPLLVCFNKDVRSRILVNTPERPYFTESECELCSGQPNKEEDQDTYEQLMTLEDKEIKFWTKYNLVPPYIEECGMDWEKIKADYFERKEIERQLGIDIERNHLETIINGLTIDELVKILEEGEMPDSILEIADPDPMNVNRLLSKTNNDIVIGTFSDFENALENIKKSNEEYE